ncbi:hypothetical protein PVAND_006696 [Polypedilum vanderplanki]|uniref:Immunoglobulin subtype domain-containing protein n=1 Tax=Polypedilum vanderplanki TaxID=319348 RepID=A0A9J6C3Z8_POLVA|nr:hypothetical protein PVAND_006696 [Polypedilum vanderplanki]
MMLSTYLTNSIFFILVLFAKAQMEKSSSASLIKANPYFVAIEEGKNVSILCSAISPITSCHFIIPGEDQPLNLIENHTRNDNYEYFGNGYENGECGITITSIKKGNEGNVSCVVDLNEHLKNIRENIPITITKELPKDNKMRTIIGIIIFSVVTVLFNCILLYCYIAGQRTANKTKRALSQSHHNPASASIIASEQTQRNDIEKQQASSSRP